MKPLLFRIDSTACLDQLHLFAKHFAHRYFLEYHKITLSWLKFHCLNKIVKKTKRVYQTDVLYSLNGYFEIVCKE